MSDLEFSTALLPEMLDASHDMLFIVDVATAQLVYVNDAVEKTCAFTMDEINAMGLEKFRRPMDDDEQSFALHIDELQREGQATDYAYIVTKSGLKIPVEVNAKLASYNDKIYNIVSARDISKRLQTEKQLSQLNKELETLIEKRTQALQQNVALLSSYKEAMDESNIVSKSNLSGRII
jgi:PAS domain S-box-containing protein